MKTFIVVGGSRGIGASLVQILSKNNKVINISRHAPEFSSDNLTHYSADILQD